MRDNAKEYFIKNFRKIAIGNTALADLSESMERLSTSFDNIGYAVDAAGDLLCEEVGFDAQNDEITYLLYTFKYEASSYLKDAERLYEDLREISNASDD